MLNQKRSGTLARLKYLVAAPVCGVLLCTSTLGFSKNYGWIDLAPKHLSAHVNHAGSEVSAAKPSVKADTNPITPKGYKYQETGYLIKGKTNYRVIITEKNGEQKEYFRNSATAADIKLLKDKYGYKFPTMAIHAALPPPPPAPPKPVKIADVPLVSPATHAFDSLYKYIAKYTRYPAKARTNLIAGRLFVRFTVADGKIADAKITRALDPEIDGEVLRVIKNFDGPLDPAFKNCNLPVSFAIIDSKGKLVGNPPPAGKDHAAIKVEDAPSNGSTPERFYMLNEVVVTTYL